MDIKIIQDGHYLKSDMLIIYDAHVKALGIRMGKLVLNSFKQARYRPFNSSLLDKVDLCQAQ